MRVIKISGETEKSRTQELINFCVREYEHSIMSSTAIPKIVVCYTDDKWDIELLRIKMNNYNVYEMPDTIFAFLCEISSQNLAEALLCITFPYTIVALDGYDLTSKQLSKLKSALEGHCVKLVYTSCED
jgi:hypothetical protein